MKTLLIPTDFSEVSLNAINFAKRLALGVGFNIRILHIVQTLTEPNTPPELVQDVISIQEKEALLKGEKIKEELENAGLNVELITRKGFILEDEVIQELEKNDIQYIIMGTNGVDDLIRRALGSNTSNIVERATCPVFVIPGNCKFDKMITNVVFATQLHKDEEQFIRKAIHFADINNAKVTLLKVNIGEENEEGLINIMDLHSNTFDCKLKTVTSTSVEEGLIKYSKHNPTDLFVMVTHPRSIIDKLFKPSVSKKVAEESNLPLLVFHNNVK